jgi:hypothetical protein
VSFCTSDHNINRTVSTQTTTGKEGLATDSPGGITLDDALALTFPASDPIALCRTETDRTDVDVPSDEPIVGSVSERVLR